MKKITSWQDVKDLIGWDLGIYTLYSTTSMAAETIDSMLKLISYSQFFCQDTLNSMFMDIAYGLFADELMDHAQDDLTIEFSSFEQGREELIRWMDLTNADDAMAYLRYLLDWEEEHYDWTKERPKSFEDFIIENK